MIDWKAINAELRKPFPKELEKSRPGGRTTLTYIDTRDVFDRLDDVVGPENWADDFQLWDAETGCVKCTITIHGISRSDVGYPNNPIGATNSQGKKIGSAEALKDSCTDAFKRAAVHWGIGRYLYQDHPPTLREPIQRDKGDKLQENADRAAEILGTDSRETPAEPDYLSFDAPTHGTPSLGKLHAVATGQTDEFKAKSKTIGTRIAALVASGVQEESVRSQMATDNGIDPNLPKEAWTVEMLDLCLDWLNRQLQSVGGKSRR